MEPYFRNQPNKSQFSGKRQWTLLLEIEKKENKTLKNFQKLFEQSNQNTQCNHSRARAVEEMFMKKTDQELDMSGNTGTYHT